MLKIQPRALHMLSRYSLPQSHIPGLLLSLLQDTVGVLENIRSMSYLIGDMSTQFTSYVLSVSKETPGFHNSIYLTGRCLEGKKNTCGRMTYTCYSKTNIVESVYLKNLEYAHSWRQNRAERLLETRVRRTRGFIDEMITGVCSGIDEMF